MSEWIKPYLEILNKERDWSWALLGIIFLLLALLLRGWILKPLSIRTHTLSKKYSTEIKTEYLKRAIWGWLLFFLSFFLMILSWNPPATLKVSSTILVWASAWSFTLSILLHLLAFGVAALVITNRHLK